nr:MAG TPA: hypothetical protein [Caudoviricetes sp.]
MLGYAVPNPIMQGASKTAFYRMQTTCELLTMMLP